MSRFFDYAALVLALAIVVLLIRGPVDVQAAFDQVSEWGGGGEVLVESATPPLADVIPVQAQLGEVDLATADVNAGAEFYQRSCRACHATKPGQHGVGPSLYGIVGQPAGAQSGFQYSDAMAQSGLIWTPDVLVQYLDDPHRFLPGTSMAYVGVSDAQDAIDLVAYFAAISVN